jgi:hypothetical protein
MALNKYPQGVQAIYKTYLGNYFVSKTSLDLEQLFFGRKAEAAQLNETVFVTGLARSGTTALFNALYATDNFASLTYANMPYLLMPNLGKRFLKTEASEFNERAHGDGILVNNKSPEAFDEYFWKVFLGDKFIGKDRLVVHSLEKSIINLYKKYMRLIAYSYERKSYLSKNNNNILRIKSLLNGFPTAKFIVMYREPLAHANSLLKQHVHFSNLQQQDPFIVAYFNYLGHHEFGLNRKPFYFDNEGKPGGDLMDLNYWLNSWKNYYSYLLANFDQRLCLISFEDLCENPAKVTGYLNKICKLENPVSIPNQHIAGAITNREFDEHIYRDCMDIYDQLNAKRAYND